MIRNEPEEQMLEPRALEDRRLHRHNNFGRYDRPQHVEHSSEDVQYYLKVVFKYHRSILVAVVLVVLCTWGLISRVQPIYEASATIQIDPERFENFNSQYGYFPVWMDPDYFNTQLKLLTNPALGRQVAEKLELDKNPNFRSDRPTTLTESFFEVFSLRAFRGSHKQEPQKTAKVIPDARAGINGKEDPLESFGLAVVGGLKVTHLQKTRLVTISYQHHDPKIAQQVVNAVAETFVRNNLLKRTGTAQSTSEFLQKRLSDLQAEIHNAEEDLIEYGKKNEIVSLSPEQNTVAERLAALNSQLIEVEGIRKEIESVYRLAKGGAAIETLPEYQNSATIQMLRSKLLELRQKRAELLTVYTEEWGEVQQIDQNIKQVEKDLLTEKNKILAGIEARYKAALGREQLLRADFQQQMGTTLKQNESAINYKIKQQEIETRKELYKNLLTQLKSVDISATYEANNISLITPASQPGGKISPNVAQTVLMAFFLSLLGGIGVAFVREYLNTKINSVEDVDRFVNLPTLGVIPTFDPGIGDRVLDGTDRLLNASSTGEELEVKDEAFSSTSVSAFNSPDSSVAEAYRHLRTSLMMGSYGASRKIILVTSGQPGEGKTTTAINMAIALAHTGARTVIIDADLRKPSIHRIFNIDDGNGLAQYLSGYIPMENLFRKSDVPNLTVIASSGARPLYPTELLGTYRLRELLEYLAETRDYVIIDTPPIIPFADALVMSGLADSCVLVVNSKVSRREIVKRACRILNDVGANLIGVVLNNIDPTQQGGYGGYYGYNYRYSYYSDENPSSVFDRIITSLKDLGRSSRDNKKKSDSKSRNLNIEIKETVNSNGENGHNQSRVVARHTVDAESMKRASTKNDNENNQN